MERPSRSAFRSETRQMQDIVLYARETVSMPHRKSHGTAVQQDCSRLRNVAQYAVTRIPR